MPAALDSYACVGLLCWLLKDAGWVLLLPVLAFPAAIAAVIVETHCFLLRAHTETRGQQVHGIATILWLFGNAVWMFAEFLFEPLSGVGTYMPWHNGPLAVQSGVAYDGGLNIARGIFFLGLILLVLFYAVSAPALCRPTPNGTLENPQETHAQANPQDQEDSTKDMPKPLVFGVCTQDVYQWTFIGPWILKDIFWTMELFWPAAMCGFLVLAVTVDCARRFGGYLFHAEVIWVIANLVWLFGELIVQDAQHWPRFACATILGLDTLLVLTELYKRPGSPDEASYILSKARSAASSSHGERATG